MLSLTTPLGGQVLRPRSMTGREAISELFTFELELRADNDASVPFASLLGRPVTIKLALPGGGKRQFHGIASRVSQGRRFRTETEYAIEVVPQFWLLTRNQQSRIFQQKSVPEVLAAVFEDIDATSALKKTYPPREYIVQYRESDFDFASRIMEEEGIYYFFRHGEGGHEMVYADDPQSHPVVPGPGSVRFQLSPDPAEPRISTWEKVQELRSGHTRLRDTHFQLPGQTLEVTAEVQPSVRIGEVTHQLALPANDKLEIYDYPGYYAQRFDGIDPGGGDQHERLDGVVPDGTRTAGIRMQEEALAGIEIRGQATARNLVAGHRFTLTRHFDGDGPYVLTSVVHRAREAANGTGEYSSSFTCIPLALPYRPARLTPRPVIAGPQTAVVVGPAGAEIFTDKYARVKVRFHWDRGNDNSSCWVRVGALHAGLERGFYALPEVDDEVLVSFLHGDPDQPVILGTAYNPDHLPPPPPPGTP